MERAWKVTSHFHHYDVAFLPYVEGRFQRCRRYQVSGEPDDAGEAIFHKELTVESIPAENHLS
jgi:hypothetical protein